MDALWERLKKRSRRLALSDQTDSDTHLHHALVTVLVFGSVGWVIGSRFDLPGLKAGLVWGLGFYALREIVNRVEVTGWIVLTPFPRLKLFPMLRLDWRYKLWDAAGDILIPCWVVLPVVLDSVVALWWLSLAVAVHHFWLRPLE